MHHNSGRGGIVVKRVRRSNGGEGRLGGSLLRSLCLGSSRNALPRGGSALRDEPKQRLRRRLEGRVAILAVVSVIRKRVTLRLGWQLGW